MQTYYNKEGIALGRAKSTMRCLHVKAKSPTEHEAHVHDPQYAMYGPYMCPGFPPVDLYDTKDRKPVRVY